MTVKRLRMVMVAVGLVTVLPIAAVVPAGADPVVDGEPEIKQTTKTEDAGPHPILKWKKAKNAAQYLVVVQTKKGAPYWTWQGPETQVRLGGGPLDALKQSDGARLEKKMVWFVIALDAEGAPVASSEKRSIAP